MSEKQSKVDSIMEITVGTAVGFVVSWAGWMFAGPTLFGVQASPSHSFGVVSFFTVLSLMRQWMIRRMFNGRSVWQALKGAFDKPLIDPNAVRQF